MEVGTIGIEVIRRGNWQNGQGLKFRRWKGEQYRMRGRKEDTITGRMSEKVIRTHTMIYSPKIIYITHTSICTIYI